MGKKIEIFFLNDIIIRKWKGGSHSTPVQAMESQYHYWQTSRHLGVHCSSKLQRVAARWRQWYCRCLLEPWGEDPSKQSEFSQADCICLPQPMYTSIRYHLQRVNTSRNIVWLVYGPRWGTGVVPLSKVLNLLNLNCFMDCMQRNIKLSRSGWDRLLSACNVKLWLIQCSDIFWTDYKNWTHRPKDITEWQGLFYSLLKLKWQS